MAIVRAKRQSNYTVIGNAGLRDSRLSLKSKGLLAYMLSLPDDWIFYETELTKHCTDGRDSIRTALKELEKLGYLVREQKRAEKGKFGEKDWKLFDDPVIANSPRTENPSADNPTADNPTADNPTLLNTNQLSTNKPSTDSTKDIMSSKHDRVPYKEIIDYLNEKADTKFRHQTKASQEKIKARFNEGFTLDDFKTVIDKKINEWSSTDMSKYLRPETLFGTKFESYLNQQTKTNKQRSRGYDTSEYDNLF